MKLARLPAALSAAAFLVTGHASAQLYDLPLMADDLGPNERAYTFDHAQTTQQKFGYDISQVRLAGKKWSFLVANVTEDPQNPKNENRVIFGKPFYAMRDGVIVSCWRNAPQNPRPFISGEDESKELWLHPERRAGRIGGGGNSLFILHDDGTIALYAHAQTGSIPSALCPNDEALLPPVRGAPSESEFGLDSRGAVPEGQRVRVKAGQFLGRVGNSGESKGPHIHIHVQKKGPNFASNNDDWVGVPMNFRRGLSQAFTGGDVDINDWTSFSGKPITKGNVVFWPPTRLSEEYARHGFDDSLMPRTWDHLVNSGFMPEVLDCYSVNGNVFYNMVWRPANASFRGFFGLTHAQFQTRADDAKADGFSPVYVESCLAKNGGIYAGVWKKVGGGYRLRHGISQAEHNAEFDKAKQDGFSPVNVAVVSKDGERRYTELYRKPGLSGWVLKSQIPESDYQKEINDQVKAKRYPVYLNVYKHDGKNWFSAIFAPAPSPNWTARHAMSAAKYQTEYNAARGAGMLTRTVAGYDGAAANHVYAAAWRK